jgi:hypothetical protein
VVHAQHCLLAVRQCCRQGCVRAVPGPIHKAATSYSTKHYCDLQYLQREVEAACCWQLAALRLPAKYLVGGDAHHTLSVSSKPSMSATASMRGCSCTCSHKQVTHTQ